MEVDGIVFLVKRGGKDGSQNAISQLHLLTPRKTFFYQFTSYLFNPFCVFLFSFPCRLCCLVYYLFLQIFSGQMYFTFFVPGQT